MDRTSAWVIEHLEEYRASADRPVSHASSLADAMKVIVRGEGLLWGMFLRPATKLDPAVVEHGVEMMAEWLPFLPTGHLQAYADVAKQLKLELDITPFLANAKRLGDAADAEYEAEQAAARAARARRKAERISQEPRDAKLEAALGDGSDPAAFSVYADWLEAHGAVRGELIHLMLAGNQPDAFIAQHAAELIGDVPEPGEDACTLTWRNGYIDTLALSHIDGIGEALAYFFEHPSGQRIRELRVGLNGFPDADGDHGDFVASLAELAPAHLELVHIGYVERDECDISAYGVGDVSALWSLPALKTVIIQGVSFDLGAIVAPNLERLELRTGSLTTDNVDAVCAARVPSLRALDLWFGDGSYGGDTTIDDLRHVLATKFPALRHLGIMNCPFVDEAVELLVESPLAAKLHELDLSLGCLGDAGAQTLLDNIRKLSGLKKLDVSMSYLSDEMVAMLQNLGLEVVADHMQDAADPDDRFVSVSE